MHSLKFCTKCDICTLFCIEYNILYCHNTQRKLSWKYRCVQRFLLESAAKVLRAQFAILWYMTKYIMHKTMYYDIFFEYLSITMREVIFPFRSNKGTIYVVNVYFLVSLFWFSVEYGKLFSFHWKERFHIFYITIIAQQVFYLLFFFFTFLLLKTLNIILFTLLPIWNLLL